MTEIQTRLHVMVGGGSPPAEQGITTVCWGCSW